MTRRRLLLAAVVLLQAGCLASQYRNSPRIAVVDGDPIVQMSDPKKFHELTGPPMMSWERHSHPPQEDARLLGVLARPPRAYPVGLLDRFEVVNDAADGRPYVIARCALTHVAAAYDRRVEGRTLDFENSAALWRDTAVLRDLETGTLWSAATGRGLYGPLAGKALEPLPAVYTRVAAWRRAHPDSVYLDLGRPTEVPFLMRLYALSSWQGVSKIKTGDLRHKPKQEILAVWAGTDAVAFTEEEIRGAGALQARLAGETLEIAWDLPLQAARAHVLGATRSERAVVPMYWFALDRHFETVRRPEPVVSSRADATSDPPAR